MLSSPTVFPSHSFITLLNISKSSTGKRNIVDHTLFSTELSSTLLSNIWSKIFCALLAIPHWKYLPHRFFLSVWLLNWQLGLSIVLPEFEFNSLKRTWVYPSLGQTFCHNNWVCSVLHILQVFAYATSIVIVRRGGWNAKTPIQLVFSTWKIFVSVVILRALAPFVSAILPASCEHVYCALYRTLKVAELLVKTQCRLRVAKSRLLTLKVFSSNTFFLQKNNP